MADSPTKPKHRRRWLRYSIRTMLVVIIVSAVLGLMANRAIKQRRAVQLVRKSGGFVVYDSEFSAWRTGNRDAIERPRSLLHDLYFNLMRSVVVVHTDSRVSNFPLNQVIDNLPNIVELRLPIESVSDPCMEQIVSLERLEKVTLSGVTNASLESVNKVGSRLALERPDLELVFSGAVQPVPTRGAQSAIAPN